MFQSARIKLTVWYVVISLTVSILFSAAIFTILHRELNFNERRIQLRYQRVRELNPDFVLPPNMLPPTQELENTENLLKFHLLYVNLLVLLVAGLGGYILAGRTLKPIKESVDKQNQFIADASHELRTPLTAMRTSIEVNLRDKNLNAKQARAILSENLQDVDKLKNLSNGLLALMTPQTATDKPHSEISIKEVIGTAIKNMTPVAKNKHITIESSLVDAIVLGDKNRLTELFVIFIDNAIKYSPENTVITIDSKKVDASVVTVIQDQGIGISQKDLPHIFERFYRVDKSRTSGDKGGYGLGLAIAKSNLAFHKGSVTVTSKENKGTAFTIKLPVKK